MISEATLPPQLIERTAVAVKNSAPLVRGGGADPIQSRDLTLRLRHTAC